MIIGVFRKAGYGFAGRLQTLLLGAELRLVPAEPSGHENAPQWRLLCGAGDDGGEIGAGWNRTGERAGAFIAVQIDDPALVAPLRANLVRAAPDGDDYHLLWTRAAPRART